MKTRRLAILTLAVLASLAPVRAQESTSFTLNEHVFNSGGRPSQGTVATSAAFRMTVDALGDGVFPAVLSGASFAVSGGFVLAYPPPQEVTNLRFTDGTTAVWDPEPSVGEYQLYRGGVDQVDDGTYGSCLASSIGVPQALDAGVPTEGGAFFYLVTARNLLDEEGTKGVTSADVERGNAAPCP